MNISYLAVTLAVSSMVAATAPDSIAEKTLFERSVAAGTFTERTILFHADGRFTFLKFARSLTGVGDGRAVVVLDPIADGVYRYTRLNERDGTIVLTSSDGVLTNIALQFFSPSTGSFSSGPSRGTEFEFIERSVSNSKPVANISFRQRVSPGSPLIVGFVVPPNPFPRRQEILVRVVGPSLAQFGVTGTWNDPDFQILQDGEPSGRDHYHADNWTEKVSSLGLQKIFGYLGAFSLLAGSKDAVDVVRLLPGAYTIVCLTKGGDSGGEALVELYFVP